MGITDEITPGFEEAFLHGIATVKLNVSCCAIINGEFYKRYDAKKGKKPPEGTIPCCEPDPITGHHPHWVKVNPEDPADKWFIAALTDAGVTQDGTYEAIGPHFQGNPYQIVKDTLMRHGEVITLVERDFESISNYLNNTITEGLVFWLNGEPVCKIKRTDFGLPWPVK